MKITLVLIISALFDWSGLAETDANARQQPKVASALTAAAFQNCFGATSPRNDTRTMTVVLARTKPGIDAGCDFGMPVQLDAQHATVEVLPAASINGGRFTVAILFFDEKSQYIPKSETVWIAETESSVVHRLADVRRFAQTHGVKGASKYLLRFRVQPQDFKIDAPAFAFSGVLIRPLTSAPSK